MKLYKLDKEIKIFISIFLILLCTGVTLGIMYVYYTTNISMPGISDYYAGSDVIDEYDIPLEYPKPYAEMLLTTHNHIISFAIIFFILGCIFYYNSIVTGTWKYILIIEPLISTMFTFGSLWLIRFIDKTFVWITIISSLLLYISFYIMIVILLYELLYKKKK